MHACITFIMWIMDKLRCNQETCFPKQHVAPYERSTGWPQGEDSTRTKTKDIPNCTHEPNPHVLSMTPEAMKFSCLNPCLIHAAKPVHAPRIMYFNLTM